MAIKEALPGEIPTSDRAQKVATTRKMKSQQETTSLGQIATVTAKPSISDNFITLTRDVLKFRRATSFNSNPEALYKDIWYKSL